MLQHLPNALTISRFAAALAFFLAERQWQIPIFIYACASEFLDGFLARRFGTESALGKILDPIADKTFVLTVIVTLMAEDRLHFHQLMMVGYRDLTVICGALVVLASGNLQRFKGMDPGWIGKVTTTVQLGFLYTILHFGQVEPALLFGTFAMSFGSAIVYVKFFFDQGLFLEEGGDLQGVAAQKRRAEMTALVGIGMFLGLLLIGAGWNIQKKNQVIESLKSQCGAACETVREP